MSIKCCYSQVSNTPYTPPNVRRLLAFLYFYIPPNLDSMNPIGIFPTSEGVPLPRSAPRSMLNAYPLLSRYTAFTVFIYFLYIFCIWAHSYNAAWERKRCGRTEPTADRLAQTQKRASQRVLILSRKVVSAPPWKSPLTPAVRGSEVLRIYAQSWLVAKDTSTI